VRNVRLPMLTQAEIVPYLLNRGFINGEQVVDGDLEVLDASRRNCNFRVSSHLGPSYLVKQGVGPGGFATVAHEAAVYRYFRAKRVDRVLNTSLPTYHGYDKKYGLLILELISNAESMSENHARSHRFPVSLAAQLGTVLAKLHSIDYRRDEGEQLQEEPSAPPWILSMHRPSLSALRELSGGNLEMIRILQSSMGLCQSLDELRSGWRINAFIHQDIKAENILVFPDPCRRGKPGVKIVDWECASYGDACWDAGSLFSDYLCFWLFSIPDAGTDSPQASMESARYPIEKIQPAMSTFWEAYVRTMQLDVAASQRWLIRAVRYAAARMLQTAFEHLQHATRMTGPVLRLLQVSANMLEQPREASIHVLGIRLPHPAK
jgi:Ser/Thr protein kinase RdoA (MazF antagonist)